MNKQRFWIAVILIGLLPFVLPFASGVYNIWLTPHAWTMLDWLVLYSFLYWPTYLIGLIVTTVALYQLLRRA